MAWYDRWRKPEADATTTTLSDVVTRYDVVDVVHDEGSSFLVVTAKDDEVYKLKSSKPKKEDRPEIGEIGSSSPSPFISVSRTEYNAELRGLRGLQTYDRMRRSDGTTRGTLRLIKTPVLAARWFVEPASDSVRDKNVAKFVEDVLFGGMSISFEQVLNEALLMCDFGYYMFEKVWIEKEINGRKSLVWQKLAPRHPMDVQKWDYDKQGGPKSVKMNPPEDENNTANMDPVDIPIEKLLVFTFDREAGNIEGISVLRSAYKHWYYKEQLYKIDAIQKERHGIGIPVIKLPPGFTQADKMAAENLGRNIRTNERAHIVLPPQWELIFAKVEGNPVDALKSIEHHNDSIRENVLASFMDNKTSTKEEDQTMFLKATRFIADAVCETFNMYAIPQLVNANFQRVGIPKLRARRIGEQQDWRTFSFAIRNLIGAGVIRPDDALEKFVRTEMDLPMPDIETLRVVQTPQAGPAQPATVPNATPGQAAGGVNPPGLPRVGMPRQSPMPPVGVPASNAGLDTSGGK